MNDLFNSSSNTSSNFSKFIEDPLFTPVELPNPEISATPINRYNISESLQKSISDPSVSYSPSAENEKGNSLANQDTTMDKVMGYGGLALQLASLLDGRKTAKLQRKSLQFNLDNARKLSAAREASVAGINNVGRV